MARTDSQAPPATERSLRNPRRRNRVESESVRVPPRRKRSKLSENTFVPRGTPEEPEEDDRQTNGHDTRSLPRNYARQTSASLASENVDMPVRSIRSSIKRTARVDSSRVLTQNDHYAVKLLPNTPKELQKEGSQFRGSISASAGLAVAITREKIFIWDYNGHSGSAGTKIIDTPFSVAQHEVLPFGTFVTTSGSTELGLLLVSATSGKILYHESIDRLTTLGFFQERRQGIEGAIVGLFSGEKVKELIPADPAGYVALLTSGRVVHISLRDAQGKPKVQSQYLYSAEQSSGGLFGSIKNMLGTAAWQQGTSAVRVRSLDRGQIQVLGLKEKGELRVWDLDWTGRYDFRMSIDFREHLQHELRQMRPAERHGDVDHMSLLDIAVVSKHHRGQLETVSLAATRPLDAILLVRCGSAGLYSYSLVELSVEGEKFSLTRILDVHAESQATSSQQPRLLVPSPGHSAFVVLSDAIGVLSLATAALNPEAQLHEASYIEPSPFQDAIYIRQDRQLKFNGGDIDVSRSSSDASCITYVEGAGLVRITTHETHVDAEEAEISIKSKIEQAVFYGYQETNLLDLRRASRRSPPIEDVEQAILAISKGILTSSSAYFDMPPTSVTTNLQKRGEARHALAAYLAERSLSLSTKTKWRLLEDAEKLSAGTALWQLFESNVSATDKGKRKAMLMHEVCEMVRSRYPFDPLWSQGTPDDIVRTFFTTQLAHVARLLPWTRAVLESVRNDGSSSPDEILRLASEGDDIWIRCIGTAYDARAELAKTYGIQLMDVEYDTVPGPRSFQDVPELWTSSNDLLKEIVNITKLSRDAVQTVFENDPNVSPEGYVEKISKENARLVDILCTMHLEHISWTMSRGIEKYDDQARRLKETLDLLRNQQIRSLAEVGQTEASIALAEKYRDMKTLTEVLIAESQYLTESLQSIGKEEEEAIQLQLSSIFDRITRYFDKFGQEFSEAFFGEGFANGQGGQMLSKVYWRWTGPITKWLQREPDRAKICWINDVVRGKDFKHAAKCLYNIALDQEENVWNKKVELSLAKLTKHAFFESDKLHAADRVNENDTELDNEIAIIDVQERLYQHVRPETYHSLDYEAAVQDAMDAFCGPLVDFPMWQQLMRQRMTKLLAHQALGVDELIDLLSLADPAHVSPDDKDANRSETSEALQVIAASHERRPARTNLLTKLIWKRAYLREDWGSILSAGSEEDIRTALTNTNVYRAIGNVIHDQHDNKQSSVELCLPSETKDAGCSIDDLATYIPHELREACLEENLSMEQQLEALIVEHNIDSWVEEMRTWQQGRQRELSENALDHVNSGLVNGHRDNDHSNRVKTEEGDDEVDLNSIDHSSHSLVPGEIEML